MIATRKPVTTSLTMRMANATAILVGAALLVTTGLIHLHLWAAGYRIPTIGTLFLTQVVLAGRCTSPGDPCGPHQDLIIIADLACPAPYENEASNSWVLSGLVDGRLDPYGHC